MNGLEILIIILVGVVILSSFHPRGRRFYSNYYGRARRYAYDRYYRYRRRY